MFIVWRTQENRNTNATNIYINMYIYRRTWEVVVYVPVLTQLYALGHSPFIYLCVGSKGCLFARYEL